MATLKLFNCIKNPILIKNTRALSSTVTKLQQTDKILKDEDLGKCTPEHDQTIYQGILSTQIKLVKGFSLTTSFISIACQPVLLMHMQQANANLAVMAGAGAFLSIFTFATPLLIHYVSKKYVTELNYNKLEDSYTAITYSLFLRKKEVIIGKNFKNFQCFTFFGSRSNSRSKMFMYPPFLACSPLSELRMYLCLLMQTNLKILNIMARSWDTTNPSTFDGIITIRRARKYTTNIIPALLNVALLS